MDLSKLTPAPWVIGGDLHLGETGWSTEFADIEFIELARNAFDVMMRRGWNPVRGYYSDASLWAAEDVDGTICDLHATDPFTALVAADKWYRENVEGSLTSGPGNG